MKCLQSASVVSSASRYTRALSTCLIVWSCVGQSVQAQSTPSAPEPEISARPLAIYEIEVEGNSVLPVELVERAMRPFVGPQLPFSTLERARTALEKLYQDAGFLSVYVDEPDFAALESEGLLRLRVIEGKLGRLKVSGSKYHSQDYIRNKVPELSEGRVPNFNVVQAQLSELNQTDDRRVQPVIKPGNLPGYIDTELQVNDQLPAQFTVELNNRQVPFTRPLRLQVNGRYNNLFQADHALSLTAITTPEDTTQSKVLALSYSVPVGGGDSWMGLAVLSDSLVEPLGAANVVGKGVTLGLRRVWSLPGAASVAHSLTFGADYKDTKERIDAGGSALSSPLRYMPFKLDYAANVNAEDTNTTYVAGGVFALRGVLRRSLDCADTGEVDQFACKREGGDGSFAAITAEVAHTRPLWRGLLKDWRARWRIGGQLSGQPLVGGEQYAIGGADTVRGYYESEAVGDSGISGGLEVLSPNWGVFDPNSWWSGINDWRAIAFAEAGRVYTRNAGNASPSTTLAGAGLGVRLKLKKALSAQFDMAWPLRSTDTTKKGSPRLHARVGVDF